MPEVETASTPVDHSAGERATNQPSQIQEDEKTDKEDAAKPTTETQTYEANKATEESSAIVAALEDPAIIV